MADEIHLVPEAQRPSTIDFTGAANGGLAIHHTSGIPIVKILWTGAVEVNPAFTIDEAARAFWDAVIRLNPHNVSATKTAEQA